MQVDERIPIASFGNREPWADIQTFFTCSRLDEAVVEIGGYQARAIILRPGKAKQSPMERKFSRGGFRQSVSDHLAKGTPIA
jgi:hypothetical protein